MAVVLRRAPADYIETLRKRNFEIDIFLGKGAYGEVWRAMQQSLNRPVAVKFFDHLNPSDESNRKRFDRERLLLARLDHPAIPYILTDGTIRRGKTEVPYIIMQLIRGQSLSHTIARKRRLDTEKAIEVTQQLLSALAYAHSEHVIHRDIAPDNIIIRSQSAALIDFSIGICTEQSPGLTRTTDPGVVIGRTEYSSPEQLADSSSVDNRTDIYSLGVVLFEMLAGHPRINHDLIDQDLGHLPLELRNIIKTACAPERDNRYLNAESFSESLKRIAGQTLLLSSEPVLSLCPNPLCNDAYWSERGYFRGPKVETCSDTCCRSCGATLVKTCRKCRAPLPPNLEDLVRTPTKRRDMTEAHCSRCGDLIFRTPTCATCLSFLKRADMHADTKSNGCSKCQRLPEANPDDDGIPF